MKTSRGRVAISRLVVTVGLACCGLVLAAPVAGASKPSKHLRVLPAVEPVLIEGTPIFIHHHRHELGVEFEGLVLAHSTHAKIIMRCTRCGRSHSGRSRFVMEHQMVGHLIPQYATIEIAFLEKPFIGRYVILTDAGAKRPSKEINLCIWPGWPRRGKPTKCPPETPLPPPRSIPMNITLPQVSGKTKVGETLACTIGTWSGSPDPRYTFQWMRDDTAVLGATESTYTVQMADEGHAVSCVVIATNNVGSKSATSIGGRVPQLPVKIGSPEVAGSPRVDETLICSPGAWGGSAIETYDFQWLRNGTAIPNAVENTYKVQAADEGQSLSCEVTANNAAGSAAATSGGVSVPSLPKSILAPQISGTPKVGELLMCSSGTWTGSPTPSYAYQWVRDAVAIRGATVSVYTVEAADEGQSLSCEVRATNTAGSSVASSAQLSVPSLPVNITVPQISGTPKVGETLTCTIGSWAGNPAPTYTYQWLRDGTAIPGATVSSYKLLTPDEGLTIACEVVAANAAGSTGKSSVGVLVSEEAREKQVITNLNNTKGDLAPYEGEFTVANQEFTAQSDTITYAGVTIGNPNEPIGLTADRVTLRLCETANCAGTQLESVEATVHNYGLSRAEFKTEVPVTPGKKYYLVWEPPPNAHESKWLAFWHGGGPYVAESQEMEAIIRGYNRATAGPYPAKREIISYRGSQPPPAPYRGTFVYAYQGFKATSNRITKLGVVVGNPRLARGAEATETINVRLCDKANCTGVVLARSEAHIINYGITEVEFKAATVTPGETYYVNWEAPSKHEGAPWVTYWLGGGPLPEESNAMQVFVQGYEAVPLIYDPSYYLEQAESFRIGTFKVYENASEEGPEIKPSESVEVTCKVFSPVIQSVEPEGYWYRIHSKPWNDEYYAAANAFRNTTGGGPGLDTDFDVPDC